MFCSLFPVPCSLFPVPCFCSLWVPTVDSPEASDQFTSNSSSQLLCAFLLRCVDRPSISPSNNSAMAALARQVTADESRC